MSYKINFEALRQEGLKPLFEALERGFNKLGIDFYLVGAIARDTWFAHKGIKALGTKAVIPIHEIPESERRFVYLKKNRDVDLFHYKIDAFPTTNICTLILKPLKNGYLFISAFPGSAAMPIPIISMDLPLYSSCKQYWDNHVFLESQNQ